jgi:hypothetical protein
VPKLIDPLKALQEDREATGGTSSAEVTGARKKTARRPANAKVVGPAQQRHLDSTTSHTHPGGLPDEQSEEARYMAAILADFRVFLTLAWRFLLGNDPNEAQLALAYRLQHGPERDVIMAFRGFSKSWIAALFGIWLLLNNPQLKVMVVSASSKRAVATVNWCLQVIMTMPELESLRPKAHQRQSSQGFDVGPALPEQSPSFFALGITGQQAGWRADFILPDDVESDQNSLTVDGREKISEAVKEFDAILKPYAPEVHGANFKPSVKFLGTPHDAASLYNELPKRGYGVFIMPARYPDAAQIKRYGDRLAKWVLAQLAKHGPGLVGRSIMPLRFTDEDFAKRELAVGKSEFQLQFMLDTSLSDKDKYPLKVRDLMVMSLDPRLGPETVFWSGEPAHRDSTLPAHGFDGDYWQKAQVEEGTARVPYSRIVGHVDPSGRGTDETTLWIAGELNGFVFLLHMWAGMGGSTPANLQAIAKCCVRYRVNTLNVEENFGSGMFAQLLRPVIEKEWERANKAARAARKEEGGTAVEDVKATNQMNKERRILEVLEPPCQAHRIIVNRSIIEYDEESVRAMEGVDTRHRYGWGYQLTHLTREKDCLHHDDRIDGMAGVVGAFADVLGVDPQMMATRASEERQDEEWERLFGPDDGEDENGLPIMGRSDRRAVGLKPTAR